MLGKLLFEVEGVPDLASIGGKLVLVRGIGCSRRCKLSWEVGFIHSGRVEIWSQWDTFLATFKALFIESLVQFERSRGRNTCHELVMELL